MSEMSSYQNIFSSLPVNEKAGIVFILLGVVVLIVLALMNLAAGSAAGTLICLGIGAGLLVATGYVLKQLEKLPAATQ